MLLINLSAISQKYKWQWAKRGGRADGSLLEGSNSYGFDSEQIKDIVVHATLPITICYLMFMP